MKRLYRWWVSRNRYFEIPPRSIQRMLGMRANIDRPYIRLTPNPGFLLRFGSRTFRYSVFYGFKTGRVK